MPNRTYVQTMARYNRWQNINLIQCANQLSDAERKKDRGSFFGSIHKTFCHILWADRLWLGRFKSLPQDPVTIHKSVDLYEIWQDFVTARQDYDQEILDWAKTIDEDWFADDLFYTPIQSSQTMSKPKHIVTIQIFNHQTHHRGQIHAMLTMLGQSPGDTDVPFMPDNL